MTHTWRAKTIITTLLMMLIPLTGVADYNGFELGEPLIPREEIHKGGPPRDGIPSIDRPVFLAGKILQTIPPDREVLGLFHNGIAKAYPVAILNWHEVVNDRFGDTGVVITFCPLCGSGMAFYSDIEGERLEFGVSGLLYNSDVLLFDRTTHSLWSQIRRQAVSGVFAGTPLEQIPLHHTTWGSWRESHPHSLLLSEETGHTRNYTLSPYADYVESERLYFPVRFKEMGLHPKERVIAIEWNGEARAWPLLYLRQQQGPIKEVVGGIRMAVTYNTESDSATIATEDGELLPATTLFWFAWAAFYPHTSLYIPEAD